MTGTTSPERHVLITGGAGYIGSLLTGELLREGYRVTVLDSLLFGGESLLGYLAHPNFHFVKADVTESRAVRDSLPRGLAEAAGGGSSGSHCRIPSLPGGGQTGGLAVQRRGDETGLTSRRQAGGGAIRVCVHLQQLRPLGGRAARHRRIYR